MTGSKDKTFVVSESGHIAGIVNPPSKKKYGHYTNDDLTGLGERGLDRRARISMKGPGGRLWEKWLRKRSGKKIDA